MSSQRSKSRSCSSSEREHYILYRVCRWLLIQNRSNRCRKGGEMVTDIKCERCGHINRAEPESQCEKCDEYLYQFYLRQKNRNRNTKIAIASVIVAIIVIGFLFKLTTLPKDKAPLPDPVKEDLINYLKQIRVQREKVQNSSAAKEYDRYVTGELNEDDKGLILSKMGLQEMPNYDNDRWEEYWKKIEVRSQQIIKSKNL